MDANETTEEGYFLVPKGWLHTPSFSEVGAMNNTYKGGGFILKLRTANNYPEWGTTIGSGTYGDATLLNGCAVDATGNLYVTGTSDPAYSSGYPVTTNGNNFGGGTVSDAIATAFNTSNAIAWSTYYGGNGLDQGNAITVDGSGNAYITGYTYSPYTAGHNIELAPSGSLFYQGTNGNGTGNLATGDAFLAEFAPISSANPGQLEWGTYFGGNDDIMGLAMTIDADNNLYIAGRASASGSFTGLKFPTGGDPGTYYDQNFIGATYEQTYVAGFNSTGYWWGTYLSGGNGEVGLGIADYNASSLYVVGYTGSYYPTYNFPLVSGPAGAYFSFNSFQQPAVLSPYISEFDLTVPTGVISLTDLKDEITVYPNPTSQEVTVKMQSEKEQDIEFILYNLFGEPVYSEKANEPKGSISKQISLSSLPNGNYILQVIAGTNVYHAKITKLQ